MIKLFVVGFPRDLDETELQEIFEAYGTVAAVNIVKDPHTGLSRAYSFVTMEDEPGATRAISALDGGSIDERQLSVRVADKHSGAEKAFSTRTGPVRRRPRPSRSTSPKKQKAPAATLRVVQERAYRLPTYFSCAGSANSGNVSGVKKKSKVFSKGWRGIRRNKRSPGSPGSGAESKIAKNADLICGRSFRRSGHSKVANAPGPRPKRGF